MSNLAPRCRHCGDVIGVYEPMTVLHEGRACRTSRADTAAQSAAGECYHDECYTRARGEDGGGVVRDVRA